MQAHRSILGHAEAVTTRMLGKVVDAARDFDLIEIEGDAAFLSREADGLDGPATLAAITDAAARGDVQLLVAYADSGLHSDVGAGENRGKRLSHDHVVRALKSAEGADANGRIHATFRFERPREAGVAPTLVAFVQRRSTGDILQAVGVPLGGCGG